MNIKNVSNRINIIFHNIEDSLKLEDLFDLIKDLPKSSKHVEEWSVAFMYKESSYTAEVSFNSNDDHVLVKTFSRMSTFEYQPMGNTEFYITKYKTSADAINISEILEECSQNNNSDDRNAKFYFVTALTWHTYLVRSGIQERLIESDPIKSALLVNIKDDNSFETKIVVGKDRPDLPYEHWMFGSGMCRPYLDEMV